MFQRMLDAIRALATPDVYEWQLAVRFKKEKLLFEGENSPFTLIPNDAKYEKADPFLFDYHGRCYLFAELIRRKPYKGCLGVAEIVDGKCGKFEVFMDLPQHLSYPCVYEKNGDVFLVAECNQSHEVTVFQSEEFPFKWKKHQVILQESAVDTTPYPWDNGEPAWLTTIYTNGQRDDRNLWMLTQGRRYCFIKNSECARSAGHILRDGDQLIRPAQRTRKHYGDALVFQWITSIDPENYHEEPALTVLPPGENEELALSVQVSGARKHQRFSGIHTYNISKDYEIIDLKTTAKPSPEQFFRHLVPYLKRKLFHRESK